MEKAEAGRNAKALMKREFDEELSYEDVVAKPKGFFGFADYYLSHKVNVSNLTTEAQLDTFLQFVTYDLELGTSIAESVYCCCRFAPSVKWVSAVMKLDKEREESMIVNAILTYNTGYTCLMAIFQMLHDHLTETDIIPNDSFQMVKDAEKTCLFLIDLGYQHHVEMKSILNFEADNGFTLYDYVAHFSEEIMTLHFSTPSKGPEQKAQALLKIRTLVNSSYKELRELRFCGFSSYYLKHKNNVWTLTTDANCIVFLQFAELDLKLGTSIAELVFAICRHSPNVTWVNALMVLADDKTKLANEILSLENSGGWTCLWAPFMMIQDHAQKTGKIPDDSFEMVKQAEKTCLFLIELGYKHGVDMKSVFNVSNKGWTFFDFVYLYSSKLTTKLFPSAGPEQKAKALSNARAMYEDGFSAYAESCLQQKFTASKTNARIQELFSTELGAEYDSIDYNWIISHGTRGFTQFFLLMTANEDAYLTRAKSDIIIELAHYDIEKGARLEQIVHDCCHLAPIKETIEEIIASFFSMTTNGETIDDIMAKILYYRDEDGANCLFKCYRKLISLGEKKHDPEAKPVKEKIEETIQFLLEMGRSNEVDMARVINNVTKTGATLFKRSALLSETVALSLIQMNVEVNEIDNLFATVAFKFPSIRNYLRNNGANPHVRDYGDDFTQYDLYLQSDPSYDALPKSIFFASDRYICRCSQSTCQNRLLDPWRYLNGVLNGQFTRVIGQGGEGVVLEGLWCGEKAAYKFVKISNQKIFEEWPEHMSEVKRELNESIQYSGIRSDLVVPFYVHYRQQLCYDDETKLGQVLGMTKGEINKYEVFVTMLCNGNLKQCKMNEQLTGRHIYSIIDQLADTQEELKQRGKCHNDVKPGNVLYVKKMINDGQVTHVEIKTKLADFGMCNQLGGTPGWSPSNFTHDRVPGHTDEYSFGLLALYMLTEDDELFYALRDNYINTSSKQWLQSFRDLPEIKVIRCMLDPYYKKSSKQDWARLGSSIQVITRQRLAPFGIPSDCLALQDENTVQNKNDYTGTKQWDVAHWDRLTKLCIYPVFTT